MSHHHHATIDRLFAHPTPHNLHWRDVVKLFGELGGTTDETRKDHLKVHLAGKEMTFQIPHSGGHVLSDDHQILAIRRFLKECGFGPKA